MTVAKEAADDIHVVRDNDIQVDERAEPRRQALKLEEIDETFEAFQALRKVDEAGANAVLEKLGANTELDRQILLELSSKSPLGHPDKFPQAHALVVRSLEVLDRNGARKIKVGPGPLKPVASYLVQIVTRFLVRSYQKSVIDSMRHLYMRREANCLKDDPALPMLRKARIHAERLVPSFTKNPVAVPTFLVGGVFASGGLSALQGLKNFPDWNPIVKIAVILGIALVFFSLAWVILQGAAVARRRIKLTVEGPVQALWQTIGRCGNPPKDQARQFALYSIILLVLSGVVLPAVVVAFL